MEHSESLNELGKALSLAQGAISVALKDSTNTFYKNSYADLASVWEACRKPLSANGLSVIQGVEIDNGTANLKTMLLHSSGQYITSEIALRVKDDGMQALGSAITYARRYSLAAMVGIATDVDDDGEQAEGRKPKPPSKADIQKAKDENAKRLPDNSEPKPEVDKTTDKTEHWCATHNCAFTQYHSKNGKASWWSHRLADGKWCNEGKIKTDDEYTHLAEMEGLE